MESIPFFSICLPAYEQVFFLKQTLDSIQKQIFTDYEIIFSDDSVTDSVLKLIETYDFKGKLKYFRQKPSLGSPENWNFTLEKAQGKWIKILHHDDSFYNEFTLQELYDVAQHSNSNWIVGAPVHPPPPQNRCCTILYPRGLWLINKYPGILAFGNCIGVPSVTLIKREISKSYDKRFIWLVDVAYYLQLIKENEFFEFYPKPIVWRNAGEHNLTNLYINKPEVELNEFLEVKKLFPTFFPFWLDLIIGAKLVRICAISQIYNKKDLRVKNWKHSPFLLNCYFSKLHNNITRKLIVFISKAIFMILSKFFGRFLMKTIHIAH